MAIVNIYVIYHVPSTLLSFFFFFFVGGGIAD